MCVEYSRAGMWEYYTWDENATSANKLYVTVASCGHSGQTGEKKRKKKEKVTVGWQKVQESSHGHNYDATRQNLLTTYHMPPG